VAAAAAPRAPTGKRSWLRASSRPAADVSDVELRTHGHQGETAAALALEVVDDGGVTRNRRRAARGSGDDGVDVAGLDAVRKTVLRRDETEPARARPCVGRSPGGLERSEHGVAVEDVGGRRAARLAEDSRALRVARRQTARARARGSGRSRRCGAKTYSQHWQRRKQRSTSASRRFLFKLSRRASSNAGHAHSCSQRSSARIAAEFDLGLQSWSSSALRLSHLVGSFSQRPLSR
jgi:hypothetical protein